MNSLSNAVPESFEPRSAAAEHRTRAFYWSVRRELWEHRSIYLAPLAGAGVFLLASLIALPFYLHRVRRGLQLDPNSLTSLYHNGAALILGAPFLVSIFYSLDSLYSERRDRAILFWKSLPVSDFTTVLAKASIPLLVLPTIALAITIVAEAIALLLGSIVLAASGQNPGLLWNDLHPFLSLGLLTYHLVTIHMLWYAPLYAWLLLISAWARRAPFVWAFLPPLALIFFERMAFHTFYFAHFLNDRLGGGRPGQMNNMSNDVLDPRMHLMPGMFLLTPGLWIGLAAATLFLWTAARIRRYRGPF